MSETAPFERKARTISSAARDAPKGNLIKRQSDQVALNHQMVEDREKAETLEAVLELARDEVRFSGERGWSTTSP
ncbi:hypothetical protein AB7M16_001782 [Bradyrhizobium sp. USDA 372]